MWRSGLTLADHGLRRHHHRSLWGDQADVDARGSVDYEPAHTATGLLDIWLDKPTADKLEALRHRHETYSDTIIELD